MKGKVQTCCVFDQTWAAPIGSPPGRALCQTLGRPPEASGCVSCCLGPTLKCRKQEGGRRKQRSLTALSPASSSLAQGPPWLGPACPWCLLLPALGWCPEHTSQWFGVCAAPTPPPHAPSFAPEHFYASLKTFPKHVFLTVFRFRTLFAHFRVACCHFLPLFSISSCTEHGPAAARAFLLPSCSKGGLCPAPSLQLQPCRCC